MTSTYQARSKDQWGALRVEQCAELPSAGSAFSSKRWFNSEVSFQSSVTGTGTVVGKQKSHPRMDKISMRRRLWRGRNNLYILVIFFFFFLSPNAFKHRTGFDSSKMLSAPTLDQTKMLLKPCLLCFSLQLWCRLSDCNAVSECMNTVSVSVYMCVWVYCVCCYTILFLLDRNCSLVLTAWGPLDGIKISFLLTCIKFFFFWKTCRISVNTLIDCTGTSSL